MGIWGSVLARIRTSVQPFMFKSTVPPARRANTSWVTFGGGAELPAQQSKSTESRTWRSLRVRWQGK